MKYWGYKAKVEFPKSIKLPDNMLTQLEQECTGRWERRVNTAHKWGYNGKLWDKSITVSKEQQRQAIAAEAVMHVLLGVEWKPEPVPDRSGDIPNTGIEVRHTLSHNNRLILHPEDRDNHAYFLITGTLETGFVVQGWIEGVDGKLPKFWRDPTGKGRWCFMIPKEDLHHTWDEELNSIERLINEES
jgi:hypothetical protein